LYAPRISKQQVIERARMQWNEAFKSLAAPPASPPMASAMALLGIFNLLIEWADNWGESGGRPPN
jgi:hypothetical protein